MYIMEYPSPLPSTDAPPTLFLSPNKVPSPLSLAPHFNIPTKQSALLIASIILSCALAFQTRQNCALQPIGSIRS